MSATVAKGEHGSKLGVVGKIRSQKQRSPHTSSSSILAIGETGRRLRGGVCGLGHGVALR